MTFAVIFFLSISCKEDEKMGVCTACCDGNNGYICYPDFTQSKCKEYNDSKVNGYSGALETYVQYQTQRSLIDEKVFYFNALLLMRKLNGAI